MTKPTISFEFFPPKTPGGRTALMAEAEALAKAGPRFMTVTYGAGGSTREWTRDMAVAIQGKTGVPTACHLTCINTFKGGLLDIAGGLWEDGIRHIVALRGDVPKEDMPLEYGNDNYFHYANEMVAALKERHDFEISVAAYPEKHPEAPDAAADLAHLKRKCAAGADRAITQFFFDNDLYSGFLDRAAAAGIDTPIVPGVLPVFNFEKMLRFAASCETTVPEWMHQRFVPIAGDAQATDREAVRTLSEQVSDLISRGAGHIHFYTLNRADLTLAVCEECGLGATAS